MKKFDLSNLKLVPAHPAITFFEITYAPDRGELSAVAVVDKKRKRSAPVGKESKAYVDERLGHEKVARADALAESAESKTGQFSHIERADDAPIADWNNDGLRLVRMPEPCVCPNCVQVTNEFDSGLAAKSLRREWPACIAFDDTEVDALPWVERPCETYRAVPPPLSADKIKAGRARLSKWDKNQWKKFEEASSDLSGQRVGAIRNEWETDPLKNVRPDEEFYGCYSETIEDHAQRIGGDIENNVLAPYIAELRDSASEIEQQLEEGTLAASVIDQEFINDRERQRQKLYWLANTILTAQEQRVFTMVMAYEPAAEISRRIEISSSRVNQLKESAIKKLCLATGATYRRGILNKARQRLADLGSRPLDGKRTAAKVG